VVIDKSGVVVQPSKRIGMDDLQAGVVAAGPAIDHIDVGVDADARAGRAFQPQYRPTAQERLDVGVVRRHQVDDPLVDSSPVFSARVGCHDIVSLFLAMVHSLDLVVLAILFFSGDGARASTSNMAMGSGSAATLARNDGGCGYRRPHR